LVLTAADVPEAAVIPNRVGAPPGTERYLQPAIARGVVRYVGEPVALVVADDRYVAEDALERIDVVYDSGDYPALFDELLSRLDYERARADQAAHNARPGPRRGI